MRPLAMKAPTFAFLLRHPAHLVALGFGTGLSPVAPGTAGTLVAFPIAWLLDAYAGTAGWLIAIVAITIAGTWCAQVTARDLGVVDHGGIVIDEIAAFLLVLFRFFDIVKPPPIRQIDRATTNALGVMADDFAAAGYALVVLAVGERLFGR